MNDLLLWICMAQWNVCVLQSKTSTWKTLAKVHTCLYFEMSFLCHFHQTLPYSEHLSIQKRPFASRKQSQWLSVWIHNLYEISSDVLMLILLKHPCVNILSPLRKPDLTKQVPKLSQTHPSVCVIIHSLIRIISNYRHKDCTAYSNMRSDTWHCLPCSN